ncbi:hypothetical protein BKA67DRAFT_541001 [Truncatella angustata]|uniref:Rhodopsin domain-containing protein n=1 Tax=Truncatella angustata TaxID=152316 RepID=A0A9P8RHA7_9PEZI|nr:uncharacterized protein BKA67DRAFT_541001 [Truncatella angustata]KAH6646008.1 hypothetical protein BKA67DRAFT_541001 [Truncatella angustata]
MAVAADTVWVSSLDETGLAIVATSITLGIISLVVVSLRAFVRFRENVFGWDDGLMAGGLVLFLVDVALACVGACRGLGKENSDLNAFMQVEATKYLMIWMLVYVNALVLIKCSICVTMYRIAGVTKSYRIAIWTLLAIIIGNYLTTFIGILSLCQPVEANWNTSLIAEGRATCAGMSAMIGLSYTSTACSIATDLACAVLPGVILWRTQMKLSTKISVTILLSFGSLASISTIIRTPTIEAYRNPTDNLIAHVGKIVLYSNIESAIGLIAGSLPSLRRLIVTKVIKSSGKDSTLNPPLGLVTFGGSAQATSGGRSRARTFKSNTENGVSIAAVHAHGNGDWRRLGDDSDKEESLRGIRAEYTYEVEMSGRAESQSLGSNV